MNTHGTVGMNISIRKYESGNRADMIDLWEQSVRATHHFLKSSDIEFYKTLVEGIDFNSFDAYCVFKSNQMVGIIGVDRNKLEMLFLKPAFIGKGIGKTLIKYLIDDLKVNQVDVNEDNIHAVQFYESFGFQVYDRTSLDDSGKPYPILRMKLPS